MYQFQEYLMKLSQNDVPGLYTYALIGIDEITPIWTAMRPEMGGLNFTTVDIGTLMSSVAPIGFAGNLLLLPWFIRR